MIETEWPFANIFKRLKTKIHHDIPSILYHPTNTIFDDIIKYELNEYIFLEDNVAKLFFSFDLTVHNSVFISANDILNIHNTHTQLIIFNHSDISDIKTEDRIILNNNLKNTYIINFDEKSNSIIDNSLNISYPIPDPIDIENISRDRQLLIINTNNNPVIKNIFNTIQDSNISVDMLTKLDRNIQSLYKIFAKYKVVMDLSNRLNLKLAERAGCNIIANKNLQTYEECDNYMFFEPNNNLHRLINTAISKDHNHKTLLDNTSSKFQDCFRKYICR